MFQHGRHCRHVAECHLEFGSKQQGRSFESNEPKTPIEHVPPVRPDTVQGSSRDEKCRRDPRLLKSGKRVNDVRRVVVVKRDRESESMGGHVGFEEHVEGYDVPDFCEPVQLLRENRDRQCAHDSWRIVAFMTQSVVHENHAAPALFSKTK
jgi:hypothetical protein